MNELNLSIDDVLEDKNGECWRVNDINNNHVEAVINRKYSYNKFISIPKGNYYLINQDKENDEIFEIEIFKNISFDEIEENWTIWK